ncbi:arsenate reductase [Endothiovibrio diazotrophicus]
MVIIYGIRNCDTVRKALKWLDARGIEHQFHDFRIHGTDRAQLTVWAEEVGLDILINRRGPSWRKIPQERRECIDVPTAVELMVEFPTIIKRPVLDLGDRRIVGFSEATYEQLFG